MKKIIIALLFVNSLFSQVKEGKTRFLITGSIEFGGDDLAYLYYEDGHTQSINAGQGGTISIGADFELSKRKDIFFRTTIGYKYLTSSADNVHVRLTRIPIELTANYNFAKKFWIGTGVVTHTGIKLNFDGLAPNEKYKTALGPILKFGYGGLGISYTIMSYKDQYGFKYSANSFGLNFAIPIPSKDWKN